jgi:hypothetical protein
MQPALAETEAQALELKGSSAWFLASLASCA